MTLKSLIQLLEKLPQDLIIRNGFAYPHSWRGIYEELSFEPTENTKVSDMLAEAKSAIGKSFVGYKGGDFVMDEETRVHFSNYGDSEDMSGKVFCSIVESLTDFLQISPNTKP
jgi:hypothetical protein